MKKRINILISFLAALILLPFFAEASSMYFTVNPAQVRQGDTVVVELRLSTGNEKINAIDGAIDFDSSALQVKEMSTGGSIFTVWPRQPLVTDTISEIFFAGGTPGGFSGDGLVAKFAFLAKRSGDTDIYISGDTDLFLNDGQGTKVKPEIKTAQITIAKADSTIKAQNAWGQTLANDMESPQNLAVRVGKDASVYGGRYFISFFATDDGSGIDHYEVKEGNADFKKVEGDYILQDQSLKSKVLVLAMDKAGNKNIVEFDPAKEVSSGFWNMIWQAVAVIAAIAIVIFIIKRYAVAKKY